MTEQEVYDLMESSKSVKEWNENVVKVQANFNGDYPSFWYWKIILSGLSDLIGLSWED